MNKKFQLAVIGIAALVVTLLPIHVAAQSLQLGGWVSSRLFAITGQPDSQIVFDRGVDTYITFASGPAVLTGTATGLTYQSGKENTGTANLSGTITSLGAATSADVGFIWGYSADAMTNNSSTVHVTGVGNYSVGISGIDETQTVYYQAVGITDGIAYGLGKIFTINTSVNMFTGYNPLLAVSPLLIWVALLIAMGALIWSGSNNLRGRVPGDTDALTHGLIKIAVAIALLAVAIVMFGLVPDAIRKLQIL